MPELLVEAPNLICALGLADRLRALGLEVRPVSGDACRLAVEVDAAELGRVLALLQAWLAAYDLDTVGLAIGTRRYTLGLSAARLVGARRRDELPSEILLDG